jgi:carnitine-CoA ligase
MQTLRQLIDHQATTRPATTFLRFGDEILTFGALRRRVAAAAGALRAKGIAAGDRVILMMTSHPDHVVIYLALAWIGTVNIELSTHLKRSGIALQLEDALPRAFIVDAAFAEDAAAILGQTAFSHIRLLVRVGPPITSRAFDMLVLDHPCGDDNAYPSTLDRVQAISYTSGTTGRPKGVIMTERYFQIGAKNAAILADVRGDDVMFMWEPFYHMAAWMTVVISLQSGVPIALVERFSASKCWDQIRATKATLFHYLGGAMNILLRQPPRTGDRDNSVRVAWGAAAPARSWGEFESRFGVTVREGYGISEAQNFTHLNLEGRLGSIGKPTEEFESWIAGEDGRRLAPREIGEIVVRAKIPGVTMQGYFNAPEKTAEVLRDGRVYTGDLGYQDEDGFFFYSGRKKDSLRRRGENVSAWEVERVINAHPAVEESAVVGVASEMGEQDIRAFVKLAPGETLAPLALMHWCERDLAYYQLPRYLDFVDDFPRGPTQRIRKSDLPVSVAGSWDFERQRTRTPKQATEIS